MSFKELGLSEPILRSLEELKHTEPSEIQQQAIPVILAGKNLMAAAQTGTGKTGSFVLPIIEMLQERAKPYSKNVHALVLTPTRELAAQVRESVYTYGKFTSTTSTAVFGGAKIFPQKSKLKKGVDVLVATPGRLLDLVNQKAVKLDQVQILVLDEADHMLDKGFIHDIKKVIATLPKKRQSLFFSATMPNEIVKLANTILKNPSKVAVTPVSSTVEIIQQYIYFVDKGNKQKLLLELLKNEAIKTVLVFTRTKHGADKVVKVLIANGITAEAIHGNKAQNARQRALTNFKNQTTRVLVATDIAARGIDVDELAYVINYEMSNIPETYVHRIGRTGRAGAAGTAYSFCDAEEKAYLKDVEKLIAKKIPVIDNHPFPLIDHHPVKEAKPAFEKRKFNPKFKNQKKAK